MARDRKPALHRHRYLCDRGRVPSRQDLSPGKRTWQDGRRLAFRSDQAQRDLTALLRWAEEHGVELTDIRVSPPTLDDVFVQLAVSAGDSPDDSS